MRKVFAFEDYNGHFESKYDAIPYNSGMSKTLLSDFFLEYRYEIIFLGFPDVINYPPEFWSEQIVLYTSSEDTGFHYKSFIEDVIFYLELCQANVIPPYKFLKANNNKTFMELLRLSLGSEHFGGLSSAVFGTREEAESRINKLRFPQVCKTASGAMSKGVRLASDPKELLNVIKRISATRSLKKEIWEYGRSLKYKGYKKQSLFRRKFILQSYIGNCDGDFKVLVFFNRFYVLKRGIKKGDFRASGSGLRSFIRELPAGLLDFAEGVFSLLKVPNASLDISFNGKQFFLIEYQCIYFGSFTLTFSEYYWERINDEFIFREGKSTIEKVYTDSIIKYIGKL